MLLLSLLWKLKMVPKYYLSTKLMKHACYHKGSYEARQTSKEQNKNAKRVYVEGLRPRTIFFCTHPYV